MGERLLPLTPSERALKQAIVALKKGAYILKYGQRGKPKLCPFRLSSDERTLIWFSGKDEQQLQLSLVTSIIRGHGTRKLQPGRESHSFSIIYMKNQAQCSLDLICKDKIQADSWFLGLKALISRCQDVAHMEHQRPAKSYINSPSSFIRRKYNLGFPKETTKPAQVRSKCVSPIPSLSDRCSFSSDSFYSRTSLSPDETKSFRVCDSCYKGLSGNVLKIEDLTPRPSLIKTVSEEACGNNQRASGSGLDSCSLVMNQAPRWGKVSSPASFRKHSKEESLSRISVRLNENHHKACQPSAELTAKHKGAKDVIKALTSRLHLMSPRAFMRKQAKACVDTPTTSSKNLTTSVKHVACDINTGINSGKTSTSDEPVAKETVSNQNNIKQKHEWVEQYRPGVYITFVMLANGRKGIKRVRFSRRLFQEREAERWWENNQQEVYDKYNVDGYINSF